MFISRALAQLKSVGAVAPSSKHLAQLIIDKADLAHAKVIVELGPGTGVFTKEIMKHVPAGSTFFAIELDETFVADTRTRYPDADIIHGSAEHIQEYLRKRGHEKADRIVSGLPWANFSRDLQEYLLKIIKGTIASDGIFLTFAYTPINYLPRARTFKKLLSTHFEHVEKTKIVVNFPPAFVYVCRKPITRTL